MCIAPAALSTFGRKISLSGLGEIKQQFIRLEIHHLGSHRNLYSYRFAIFSRAVRPLAVVAALCLVFRVIPKVKERIQPLIRFEPYIPSDTAISAGRPTARNEL